MSGFDHPKDMHPELNTGSNIPQNLLTSVVRHQEANKHCPLPPESSGTNIPHRQPNLYTPKITTRALRPIPTEQPHVVADSISSNSMSHARSKRSADASRTATRGARRIANFDIVPKQGKHGTATSWQRSKTPLT